MDTVNPKKRAKKTGNRVVFWLSFLLLAGIGLFGWYLWDGIYTSTPQFNYLLININGEPQRLISGEGIVLHPRDRIKVVKVSTNIPFNIGVRLFSRGFDAQALLFQEMNINELFTEDEIFDHCEYHVVVKHFNREIGYIEWKVEPYLEDWLEKASRAISRKRRIAILEKAARALPDRREIRQRLAREYIAAKMWNNAARLLEDLVKEKPDRDLYDDLLQVYKWAGNKKGIKITLNRIIGLWPQDPGPRYELAELLETQKRFTEAIKQYEALIKIVPPQEKVELYDQLGYLNAKKQDFKKAIFWYEKALPSKRSDENIYYNLAYLYEKIGKKEKAASYLEQALKFKKGDLEGRLKLAQAYYDKKRYKKAKTLVAQVLKKRPSHTNALLLLVKIEEKLGDKAALKKAYKKLLVNDPKNDTVLYNLAALEYETGNLDSAARFLERYLKLRPEDKDAHLLLFQAYKRAKNGKKAFQEALKALQFFPRNLELYEFVFEYLKGQKRYDEIIKILNRGLKSNPKATALREYLVFCYLEKGDQSKAMAQLEKIVAQRPKDARLWLHLAKLRESSGLYHEALVAYKHVVELDPGNEEAAEAYLKLRLRGFEKEKQGGTR